ncbi:MAG: glycosyltransferase family 39 protein [Candidatus Methanoperedens sp.]|nr:glycosyltransferase family 39 protein [Candidatus Methanoperedens sp.]
MAEFLPERTKISLINSSYIHTIDKMILKYGIAFLCFLIITGFYLRFNNLGNLSFWIDELITSYAAIGILKHGTPVLPSGELYTRSIFNTSLIALSFKIFGVSEFSARIISVVFGTLTIPLVYLLGVKVANRRVGLLAALLIAFSAWEILWSRQARMYAQFQFFYLLTAYLFYVGLNKKDIRILLVSAVAFYGAYLDHILALSFIPVVVLYLIYSKREMLKNRNFIYRSLPIIFGFVFVVMIFFGKNIIDMIFYNVPIGGQKPFYYYLLTSLKILLVLVLISIIISIILWKFRVLKIKTDTTYILLNFFIPFLILSIYAWKDSRYALFIFPFIVLSASIAIDLYVVQNIINENVVSRISSAIKLKMGFVRNVKFAVLFIMVLLLFTQMISSINAFYLSQKDDYQGITQNWKKGSEYVKPRLVEGNTIITTVPLATLYYLGDAGYYLRQFEYKVIMNNEGQLVDRLSGAIILDTYDSFMEAIKDSKGWAIVDHRIDMYFTDPKVRDHIKNNMTFHPDGSDDTIKVYSWDN